MYRILTTLFAGLVASASASAVTITIVNTDGAGEGLNDPTVVAALPSNPATTLGAQRLAVLQQAANQWGALLAGNVEIRVSAQFNAQTCSGTSAVLGSAGANTIHQNFANAPVSNRWYPASLANQLANSDLNGGSVEINSQFNFSIDAGCLSGTVGWYYTTSEADPSPTNRIPLLPVVFHELGHGLGFQTFTSSSTGAPNGGFFAIWDNFLTDAATGTAWSAMASDSVRQASAISDPNLIWTGPITTSELANFLRGQPQVQITAPVGIATTENAQAAAFGALPPQSGLTGEIVVGVDSGGVATNDGCEALTNAAAIAGKIALLRRGNCNFTVKVKNAQDAGAVAALIDNNAAAGLPGMGGSDPTVTIPSFGISQALGDNIRAQVVTVSGGLVFGSTLAGTQVLAVPPGTRHMRMNAPNPVQPGSSVSHFTVDAFPNLLMEPAINNNLFDDVDLTIPLFRDIGWQLAGPTDAVFSNSFE